MRERGILRSCCVKDSRKHRLQQQLPDGDGALVKHLHFQQDVSN